jgi:hypothetical protein
MAKRDPLRRIVWKERLQTGLVVAGMGSFLAGFVCMPGALVNPKQTTSLFAVFAAAGLVVRYGVALMVLGVVLFCAAAFVHKRK